MSVPDKQAKDSNSPAPAEEKSSAALNAVPSDHSTTPLWSKFKGVGSKLFGLSKALCGLFYELIHSFIRFLCTSRWFNYLFTALIYLTFSVSVPLLIWSHYFGLPAIKYDLSGLSLPYIIGMSVGWSVLFITHFYFWIKKCIAYVDLSKKLVEATSPSKSGSATSPIPPARSNVDSKDKSHAAVLTDSTPKLPGLSPNARKRRDQFEAWAKSMSSKMVLRSSSTVIRLLDKLPEGLVLGLKLRGASSEATSGIFDLGSDGILTCVDFDRLILVQPVSIVIIAEILPGLADKFEESDKPKLNELISLTISCHLEDAEKRYLEWFRSLQRLDRLPNVKEAEPVDINLADHLRMDQTVAMIESVDSAKSGLVWNPEKRALQGSALSGNHEIPVKFACANGKSLPRSLVLRLTCTMNPEQMWHRLQQADGDKPAVVDNPELSQQLQAAASSIGNGESGEVVVPRPSPDFGKPHRVRCAFETGGLQVRYASVRGRSHIQSAKFREDHVGAVPFHDGRALALVVSDGAGSAVLSRRGSEIVVHIGLDGLRSIGEAILADPSLLQQQGEADIRQRFSELVGHIRERIEFESEQIRIHRPSFADKGMYATFLGCLVLPLEGRHVILSYAVGDGAIGIGLATEGGSGLKSSPDHGESAGQTLFILSKGADDASRRLRIDNLSGPFALILMSDGVSDPHVAPEDVASPERWNEIATELARLDAGAPTDGEIVIERPFPPLVDWLEAYQKSHHDDRSIACVFHQIT
jgi:hypothetical protein